jgi:hypothetical protein
VSERFADLTKLPRQPAARLLALANAKLKTPLDAPASAPVEAVLAELEAKGALIDMLRMLSVALPARERVWWACLAARDTLPEGAPVPPPLKAAEAWVFKPTDENRAAAQVALEFAEVEDETVHCARAVQFADGKLGAGDLAEHQGPPGASETCAFAMNVIALGTRGEGFQAFGAHLVDRALDIARGGSGRIEMRTRETT